MVDLQDRIASLPGDLFSIKSVYLGTLQSIASSDINSAVVLLGKAGERLAKGALRHFGVRHEENASFDVLLRHLSAVSPSPVLVVGLRTVLKYRNQAAHDTMTQLGMYDLDAALSSFCAAYQAVYAITGDTAQEPDSPRKAQAVQSSAGSPGTLFLSAHLNKLSLLTSLILLVAIIRGGSYDFFLVVRIVVTINSALLAWRYYRKRTLLALLFGGVAVLFNPVLPVFFSREVWRLIDAAVLGLLLWSVFRGKLRR